MLLLLLSQCGYITAQKETILSPYGKKVIINTNSLNTADNGLTASNAKNVQLGGTLIKATTLETDPINILEIQKDTPDALQITDGTQKAGYRLTSDANGVATWKPDYLSLHARYTTPEIKLTANVENNLTLINTPKAERSGLSTSYVAPISGVYLITISGSLSIEVTAPSSPIMRSILFSCKVNGNSSYETEKPYQNYNKNNDFAKIELPHLLQLKQGDNLTFAIKCNTNDTNIPYSYFNIDVMFIGY